MKKILVFVTILLASTCLSHANELDTIRKTFVEASAQSFAPSEELTEKFVEYSSNGRANDVLLLQLYNYVHLPEAEVQRLLDEFDWEQACWKDIDYEAKDRGSWPSTLHVTRMVSLAKLYVSEESAWKGSPELGRLLHLAMNWWFENMPVCPNWWHNDIGVPKKMTTVLLMLRDELSEEEVQGGLKVLERSKFGRTGQNKVWLAGNNLMKGLLIDDPELVRQARDYIAEEIYITEEEGIQPDWSFHQHGPQIQFGNYGLAYADGLCFWMRVLKGSSYAFSEEQEEILTNLMKKGICLCVWKGVMDPSFCGRQNFINAGPGKAFALAVAAQNMAAALEGEDAEFFENVAAENLQPELYNNTICGGTYYWRSDCGIWRRPQWYASIRMHSERTIGFEFTNKENTLANFSADGALILMRDGKEFDNIFACWDWRKLPGVTAYDDGKPLKCDDSREGKCNRSRHVGGLVAEDAMTAVMELNRDGLHALKSSFFFEDCVVNLGADIRTERGDFISVTTALDQTLLRGKVRKGKNYQHHNKVGYISLDGAELHCSAGAQYGKWDDIDPVFHDKRDTCEIFKLWFEHPLTAGVEGEAAGADTEVAETDSYAYLLYPDQSRCKTARAARRIRRGSEKALVEVLRNDKDCQAVRHGDVICVIFHVPGAYTFNGQDFASDSPAVLISDSSGLHSTPLEPLHN